ncbi:MAG: ABC transporter permease [Candidatus Aminicenantes bacterium]|nr:MAG: ABC transporter permease [Candidatus Aminicenantes bacterium]
MMYKNFLKVAFRNLLKNKLNTLIIILGLGTGITCSILSFLFIHHELSFDRFHENIDTIYEMKMVLVLPMGRAIADPKSHLALDLARQFPEVIRAVRVEKLDFVVSLKDDFFEQQALAADPTFFSVFTFPFEYGEGTNALDHPDAVVLSKATAKKYFGEENPLGETLSIRMTDEYSDFIVTGVLEEIPSTSSFQFDLLINLERVHGSSVNDPQKARSLGCFIQLNNADQVQPLIEKFKTSIDVPLQERFSKESGHDLKSLAAFHLKGEYGSEVLSQKSTINYSYILAGISLLVLVIACFNFVNLSIGKAATRIKEIGVRKVLGAKRKQLIQQFWFESLFLSFLSLTIALVMVELFLPPFNRLSQKNLRLDAFSNEWAVVFCLGIVFFVGIVAGSYPAFFLSKFSSVDLFRRRMRWSRKNTFNRSLIVFQFAISIFLIISTGFMYKQKSYMLNIHLGYNTDQVVVLPIKNLKSQTSSNVIFLSTLKNNLLSYPMIQGVSGSTYNLSEGWMGTYFEKASGDQELVVYNYVDKDFIPTLGMRIIAGRNFSDNYPSDLERSILVNESLAKLLGGLESPVGHNLSEFFKIDLDRQVDRQVIGVVEDFHSQSLHDPIYPSFMGLIGMDYNYVFVKLKGVRNREAIANIEKEFKTLAPHIPFEYSFLDTDVAKQYEREEHWVRLVEYASLFAILIACSGLFGLTLQIVFLRIKEIGIRKVLGASVQNILLLINREFMWLVLLANLIAWPSAYLAMSVVLKNYAFRITLTPWIFIASGFLALLLAAATISIHAVQAAVTNPSETLRYE